MAQFNFDASQSKDYLVNCHWALYCDNYLEGFHIPFVHEDLNAALDYGSYTTELFQNGSLQIGYSSGGEEVFDLPIGHPDEKSFYFCGRSSLKDFSYCKLHLLYAYQPKGKKEEATDKDEVPEFIEKKIKSA